MVPRRSAQQHVHVAVSRTGLLVAVLPYDNKLRLLHMLHRRIEHQISVPLAASYDTWDVKEGRRAPRDNSQNTYPYADEAGLDVESSLQFSPDDKFLLLATREAVMLFELMEDAGRYKLRKRTEFCLGAALLDITGTTSIEKGVGSTAALSPDRTKLAWIVFAGSPSRVFLTIWSVDDERVVYKTEVTKIYPRRWSALGWARVVFSPNGRYCIVVVNCAKKVLRVESVDGEICRTKLCRFVIAVFEMGREGAVSLISERCDWLEMSPEAFAEGLCAAVARSVGGLALHAINNHLFGDESVLLNRRRESHEAALLLNCVHSCPGEASYKALSFGQATRHPWFVTKQPMYSFLFGMSGRRVHVATSPHANAMQTIVKIEKQRKEYVIEKGKEEVRRWRDGRMKRRQVFRNMPWRTSFATVTAFSTTGKWVAGASLLDDDQCCVCVRNMTLAELFT